MSITLINELAGDTDIYLLDQILKGRYRQQDTILDAGCGGGRNMHWFLQNNICIYGIDEEPDAVNALKRDNPALPKLRLQVAPVENLPFGNGFFDHVISSAVLHFARSTEHFVSMMAEMVRVLKTNGTLFIRMTSVTGIEDKARVLKNGVYDLPDGSTRFLLTPNLLEQVITDFSLSPIEPLKTVNVNGLRCMCTLVLQKQPQSR